MNCLGNLENGLASVANDFGSKVDDRTAEAGGMGRHRKDIGTDIFLEALKEKDADQHRIQPGGVHIEALAR